VRSAFSRIRAFKMIFAEVLPLEIFASSQSGARRGAAARPGSVSQRITGDSCLAAVSLSTQLQNNHGTEERPHGYDVTRRDGSPRRLGRGIIDPDRPSFRPFAGTRRPFPGSGKCDKFP
jgi:hypothetical protein